MSLIDDFLESVTDENGNKIDFSNIDVEGFSGVVSFSNLSYYADIKITEDEFEMYNSNLNWSSLKMVESFVNYVQQKMKESREYFKQNKIN